MKPATPLPDPAPDPAHEAFARGLAEMVRLLARQAAAEHHRARMGHVNLENEK
jgi:hypothetical protein